MSEINFLCSICTEIFRNVDSIHSTSCGHVFHSSCMDEWKRRSNSCPQCRNENHTTHKLFLNFEDTDTTVSVKELKVKLEKSQQELNEVKLKLDDKDILLSRLSKTTEKDLSELTAKFNDKVRLLKISETAVIELSARMRKRDELLTNCRTEFGKEIARLEEENLLLKKVQDESANEIAQLKDQLCSPDKNTKLILELKQTIAGLEQLNTKKSEEIVSLTNTVTSLEKAAEALKNEADALRTEYESSLFRNAQLTSESTRLKELTDSAPETIFQEKPVQEWKKEMSTLNENLRKTTKELEDEVSKNDHLTLECIRLKSLNSMKNDSNQPKDNDSGQIMIYQEKLKVLEQRLKHISAEFEKEITKSTQLEIDKIKLQSLVDHMKLNSSTSIDGIVNEQSHRNEIKNITNLAASSESLNSIGSELRERRNMNKLCNSMSSSESLNVLRERAPHKHGPMPNSIIIQKYPCQNMIFPLENTIINLARHMDILLDRQDILEVHIVGRYNCNSTDRVSLLVRFKNLDMKIKFLVNKRSLSKSSVHFMRSLWIKEFVDQGTHDLYGYAKNKLSQNGFNDIVCMNNQIVAKKNRSDARGIQITTRQQVDELSVNPVLALIKPESSIDEATNRTDWINDQFTSSENLNMRQIPQRNESTANSIIIQNYPYKSLNFPLENTVEHLATNMGISLDKHDILKVNIVGRNNRTANGCISLFVQFKTRDIKTKLLTSRSILSSSSILFMRSLRIKEYRDEKIQDVFLYAKDKLTERGFDDIFLTNNQIFAKKNRLDDRGIQIYTRQQVDELLTNSELSRCQENIDEFMESLQTLPGRSSVRRESIDEASELL